jgi:hypothetical protein
VQPTETEKMKNEDSIFVMVSFVMVFAAGALFGFGFAVCGLQSYAGW